MGHGRVILEDPCFRTFDPQQGVIAPCTNASSPSDVHVMPIHRTVSMHRCRIEGLLHELGHTFKLGHSGVVGFSNIGQQVSQVLVDGAPPDRSYYDFSSIMSLGLMPDPVATDGGSLLQPGRQASNLYRGFNFFHVNWLFGNTEPVIDVVDNAAFALNSLTSRQPPFVARIGVLRGEQSFFFALYNC